MTKRRSRTWDDQRAKWETPNRGGSITRGNTVPPTPPYRDDGDEHVRMLESGDDDCDHELPYAETEEVTGAELRVGDVIRCRPYRGIPGLPRFCAHGDGVEFTIGRIEATHLGGNQRYHMTMVVMAVELHEVLYIGEHDVVNLVRRGVSSSEAVGLPHERAVVKATAVVLPAPKALPAPTRRLPG